MAILAIKTHVCDFCGKTEHQVVTLIAGPRVCICDECVKLCAAILTPPIPEPTDATFYRLGKGEKAAPVVCALLAAGLSASPTRWLGRGVMVQPPTTGQANKRHAANEAMFQSLQRAGWPVSPYYQMD